MNLNYFEIVDRVYVLRESLEANITMHPELYKDEVLVKLCDEAQLALGKIYSYASGKFDESCNEAESSIK